MISSKEVNGLNAQLLITRYVEHCFLGNFIVANVSNKTLFQLIITCCENCYHKMKETEIQAKTAYFMYYSCVAAYIGIAVCDIEYNYD